MAVEQGDAQALQGKQAGATVQLAADYLSYARQRFDAGAFKSALTERLLPTVPRGGRPLAVGPRQAFGKFQIRDPLGKGGMAEVFLAFDPELAPSSARERDHLVALKVMKEEIAHEPAYVGRFLREAANASLIDHRNVVRVLEVGSVRGRLYYTMELVEGETLKEYMSRGPADEDTGIQILCQLVDGLIAAHERGIGHRDLKPSNVMLLSSKARYGVELADEFDVTVKVTDFGLAQMLDTDKNEVLPEGRFLGTAKYVAPEVVKGQPATLKSDVFSLGILAYQMFSGEPPFRARNKMEYIAANVQAEARPLAERAPVSPELGRVIDRMLHKDPANRPGADALRRDLGRLMARSRTGQTIEIDDDPTSAFHVAPHQPARGLPAPGLPHLLGLAGGLALVVVLAVLLLREEELPPPAPAPSATASASPELPAALPSQAPPEDPLLAPVSVPGASAFPDRLARQELVGAVEEGDAAWRRGDAERALERWSRASSLAPSALPRLQDRVLSATRTVALARADQAERAGDPQTTVRELERARDAGVPADEVAPRLAAARRRLEREDELDRRLLSARERGRREGEQEAAIAELRGLIPLARELGRTSAIVVALERLGASAEEPAPSPGVSPAPGPGASPAPSPAPSAPSRSSQLRAELLLDLAEQQLADGHPEQAAQAVDAAEASAGPSERSRELRARLPAAGGGGR